MANSIISLPYYLAFMLWEGEFAGVANYFTAEISPFFVESMLLAVVLAFAS